MRRKKFGTMKCRVCSRTIRYKVDPKYVDRDPNRLIAIRKHYSRYHPAIMKRWHRGIKHVDAKHPRGERMRKKKWGKIGAPKSAKRRRWLAKLRRKR